MVIIVFVRRMVKSFRYDVCLSLLWCNTYLYKGNSDERSKYIQAVIRNQINGHQYAIELE